MSQFFGSMPKAGVWTAVGLSRSQFVGLVGLSTLLFIAIGGPVWQHTHSSHLVRIVGSYAIIPPLAALALHRNRTLSLGRFIGATALVSMIKLILTAVVLIAAEMVR